MIELVATVLSIGGAILMCSNTKYSKYTYALWPFASFLWTIEAYSLDMYGWMAAAATHTILESIGAYNWLIRKK